MLLVFFLAVYLCVYDKLNEIKKNIGLSIHFDPTNKDRFWPLLNFRNLIRMAYLIAEHIE